MPEATLQITVNSPTTDVDGAPNAYGPQGRPTLDDVENALNQEGDIVGYLTQANGVTPLVQSDRLPDGSPNPFSGYYISITAYTDPTKADTDPRKYVDASKINYVVRGRDAIANGVNLGDFVKVHSVAKNSTVYAIVGDAGNSSGAEFSLALFRNLGYVEIVDGRTNPDGAFVIRYFANSNPDRLFFTNQQALDQHCRGLNLS